jgi:low temperature requirement protein LtrA
MEDNSGVELPPAVRLEEEGGSNEALLENTEEAKVEEQIPANKLSDEFIRKPSGTDMIKAPSGSGDAPVVVEKDQHLSANANSHGTIRMKTHEVGTIEEDKELHQTYTVEGLESTDDLGVASPHGYSKGVTTQFSSEFYVVTAEGGHAVPLKLHLQQMEEKKREEERLRSEQQEQQQQQQPEDTVTTLNMGREDTLLGQVATDENDFKQKAKLKLLSKFFRLPKLRNQNVENKHSSSQVSWSELFYDLIFVAALNNLADYLKHTVDEGGSHVGEGLGLTVLYWILFMQTWTTSMFYWTRFENHDAFSNVLFFFYNSGIIGMATNMIDGLDDRRSFSIGYCVSRSAAALLYFQVSLVNEARLFGQIALIGHIVTCAVALISAFTSNQVTLFLWALQPFLEFGWVSATYKVKNASIPVNIEHICERAGLLTLLVHGESVIALITGTNIKSSSTFVVIFIGFLLVFVLRMLYSSTHPTLPEEHALRRTRLTGNVFFYMHFPLGAALLGIGTAVKLLRIEAESFDHPADYLHTSLLCYSLGVFFICLNIMRLAHHYKHRSPVIWAFRIIVIVLTFAYPTLQKHYEEQTGSAFSAPYIVCLCAVTCIMLSLLDRIGSVYNEIKYSEDEDPKKTDHEHMPASHPEHQPQHKSSNAGRARPRLVRQASRFRLDTAVL